MSKNRGENLNEIILVVAGILLTLLVVFFGFKIYDFLNSKGQGLVVKMDETFTNMDETKYTQYNGERVSGGSITNFIKECENSSDQVYVLVKTNKNPSGVTYAYNADGTKITTTAENTLIKNSRNSRHNDYINPGQFFYGEVIRDTNNNVILGVVFTEEAPTS